MINVVLFEPRHLALLKPRACHSSEVDHIKTMAYLRHTFLIEETPIAIFGGVFTHKKLFSAWAIVSDEVKRAPIEFARKVKRLLDIYMEQYELYRLEIQVRCDYKPGFKFAHALGFTLEGILAKYGLDGSDYYMFARTQWQK